MRTRLVVNGYKNFSRLSASGEDTSLILENITKSGNTKYIRKFEFDPYLCEKSYIKLLAQTIRKYKNLQSINIVIRRLDSMNESNILEPFLIRLIKLWKLRLELTKIENMNDKGMIRLAWMTGKLISIRECEEITIGMDHTTQFADMHFAKYGRNLKRCVRFKKTIQRSALVTRCEGDAKIIEDDYMRKMNGFHYLKEMDFSICMPQGWLTMSTEIDESAARTLQMISMQHAMEKLYIRFSGNPVPLETVQIISDVLPKLKNLKSFGLDFLNSRLSETEVVLFAQLLPQLKSLERLKFKVIQYPNVSEGCIYYLISTLSKLPNIKCFQIYFRRLVTSSEMVKELLKRIKFLENIECCVSKQSLLFYRTEKT